MLHHRMRRAVAGRTAPSGGRYTAKSVALDYATNYGFEERSGFRCIEFKFEGDVIAVSGISGETTLLNSSYQAFDSFYSRIKTGDAINGWLSEDIGIPVAGQRIWATFTDPITFDAIVVNNFHATGAATDAGIKDTKIRITEDTGAISDIFDSAIAGSVLIYDGVIREHISSDVADDETLVLL